MSSPAVADAEPLALQQRQRSVAVAIGGGLVALGLIFRQEVAAAVHTWIVSTAYNHCFLVIPIVVWLLWDRRATLRGATPEPLALAALACIPVAFIWLLADRLGVMEGRQLAAMTFVELLFLSLLGWRLCRQIAGPLLYLYFLVPFGEFLTPKLQDITTVFVRYGLDLLQIPAYIDGYTIEIPEGMFYIAEACAGLRFLIASIAFGVLYALLMYRSPLRRLTFIVASIIVPVVANGMRAIGIVALGHVLGSAQAAATDHVLYGWIFFSLVILLLIVLGLPFRQDAVGHGEAPPRRIANPGGRGQWRTAVLPVTLVIVFAAASPAAALRLDRSSPPAMPDRAIDVGDGCAELPAGAPARTNGPARLIVRRVSCGGIVFDVKLALFSTRTTAAPVFAMARQFAAIAGPEPDEEAATEGAWLKPPPGQSPVWRITRATRPAAVNAVGMWIDGKPAIGGMAVRLRLAWTSLVGAPVPAAVVGIAPEVDQASITRDAARAITERLVVLLEQADVSTQVERILASHD